MEATATSNIAESAPDTPDKGDAGGRAHHRGRTALIVIAIILAVCAAAFAVYANDYYHADSTALAACISDDQVPVTQTADAIVFGNPDTAQTGFIFYPGAKVQAESYAPLMRSLALRGYLCVLQKMPFNLAFFNINAADRSIAAYPGIDSWYVGGHSLGGAMVSMWAGGHANQIDGVFLLGSYSTTDLSATGLTEISIYGSNDGVLNRQSYADNARLRPTRFEETVIEGGNHAGFGDYGKQAGDGDSTISADEQQEQTVAALSAAVG